MKDPLKEKRKVFVIDGKEFDQTHVPAYRVIEASKKWNQWMLKYGTESGGLSATEDDIIGMTLDLAIYLLGRDIKDDLGRWWNGLWLSRKKLLRSMSYDELNSFVDEALEPILGSKKKALAAQKKVYDITAEKLNGMSQEDLANLLQKLPSLLDGLVGKSSA